MTTKEEAQEIIKQRCIDGKVKLYLGNGYEYWDGFVNIDLNPSCAKSDIYMDCTDLSIFDDNSVDEIHTYHTIEHIGHRRLVPMLIEWRRILKPGGKIIIETPNLSTVIQRFASLTHNSGEIKGDFGDGSVYETLYGGQKDAGSFHISCLTPYQMMVILKASGFDEVDNNGNRKIIREIPQKGIEYGFEWNMRFRVTK